MNEENSNNINNNEAFSGADGAREEKYDLGASSGMKFKKGKFGLWFENFWYHYKWHTLITAFVLIVLTVCTVQMCKKTDYDVHIIYAGNYSVMNEKTEGGESAYEVIKKSLTEAVDDFDENGETVTSFEALYMLSPEEIEAIEKELADKKENGEGSYTLNYTQLNANNNTFRDRIMYSEYYLFFLSESVYNYYKTVDGITMFVPLKKYVKGSGDGLVYLDDSAIYLHSTEFGKLPGLCELPEDTVIALRSMSAVASHFGKKSNEKSYKNCEKTLINILNYGS